MEHIHHQGNVHYMPKGSSVDFYLADSFPYDLNLVTACFCLVFYQNRVLFTQEKDIGHLDLDIPGGHRDEDETIECTITREVFEETGIMVHDFSFVGFAEFNVINPPKNYWYPYPKSYILFYVAILKEFQQVNEHGIWLTIDDARHIPWVKDNVVLFESMYQEAKYLRGDFKRSYLDVYDENGTDVIGKETYDTVHRQGLWHKGVHVFVLTSEGQFIIQKRGPLVQTKPNLLEASAGGHINSGHDAIETVVYELQEEIGVTVKPDEIEYVGQIVDVFEEKEKGIKNNEFDEIYLIRKDIHPDNIVMEHKEVSDVVFIDAKEFLARGIALDPTIAHRPEEYKMLYRYIYE